MKLAQTIKSSLRRQPAQEKPKSVEVNILRQLPEIFSGQRGPVTFLGRDGSEVVTVSTTEETLPKTNDSRFYMLLLSIAFEELQADPNASRFPLIPAKVFDLLKMSKAGKNYRDLEQTMKRLGGCKVLYHGNWKHKNRATKTTRQITLIPEWGLKEVTEDGEAKELSGYFTLTEHVRESLKSYYTLAIPHEHLSELKGFTWLLYTHLLVQVGKGRKRIFRVEELQTNLRYENNARLFRRLLTKAAKDLEERSLIARKDNRLTQVRRGWWEIEFELLGNNQTLLRGEMDEAIRTVLNKLIENGVNKPVALKLVAESVEICERVLEYFETGLNQSYRDTIQDKAAFLVGLINKELAGESPLPESFLTKKQKVERAKKEKQESIKRAKVTQIKLACNGELATESGYYTDDMGRTFVKRT